MGFEIVRVGRELGTNLLELEGNPTLRYTYEGVTKTVERVSSATLPEKATDISLNGVPVRITRQSDRTILHFGDEIHTHVMREHKTQWSTTIEHLDKLRSSDPHVRADRRSGKTTALCMRAIELRMEGNSVNIIAFDEGNGREIRGILRDVALDLYPSGHDQLLAAITVSCTVRDCFDRYLVDEISRLSDHIRCYLPKQYASVTT